MKNTIRSIHIFILFSFILSFCSLSLAQSPEQQALKELSFLIGDWKGTGQSYLKEGSKPYDVLSNVSYDLDGELLVLKHRSFRGETPVLSLRTLIYFNQKDQHYYYNAYTKSGTRPFKCQLHSQQFICKRGNDYRLIFQLTDEGEFNEYGEKLVDGQWQKNFEDILKPSNSITLE